MMSVLEQGLLQVNLHLLQEIVNKSMVHACTGVSFPDFGAGLRRTLSLEMLTAGSLSKPVQSGYGLAACTYIP